MKVTSADTFKIAVYVSIFVAISGAPGLMWCNRGGALDYSIFDRVYDFACANVISYSFFPPLLLLPVFACLVIWQIDVELKPQDRARSRGNKGDASTA
jgi:hypothetical protein